MKHFLNILLLWELLLKKCKDIPLHKIKKKKGCANFRTWLVINRSLSFSNVEKNGWLLEMLAESRGDVSVYLCEVTLLSWTLDCLSPAPGLVQLRVSCSPLPVPHQATP